MQNVFGEIKVYTVLRERYLPNKLSKNRIYDHRHDYYQLIYAINENGSMVIEGERIRMNKGDVLILKRNFLHNFYVEDGVFETHEIKFVFLDEEYDILKDQDMYFCNDNDGSIRRALKNIEFEIDYADKYSRNMVALELGRIILMMARKIDSAQETQQNSEIFDEKTVNDEQYRKVMEYIDDNLGREITVKDISDIVCIEYKYFSHCFAAKYGIRLKRYIRQKRMERAKDLLTHSDKSMTEIAESCGFGSIHYFTRVFKKEEMMSPTEFRKRFKNFYSVQFDQEPNSFSAANVALNGTKANVREFVQKKQ